MARIDDYGAGAASVINLTDQTNTVYAYYADTINAAAGQLDDIQLQGADTASLSLIGDDTVDVAISAAGPLADFSATLTADGNDLTIGQAWSGGQINGAVAGATISAALGSNFDTINSAGGDVSIVTAGNFCFVKEAYSAAGTQTILTTGQNDTINGSLVDTSFISLDDSGIGNNLWLAEGATGQTMVDVLGQPSFDLTMTEYTIENVNPAVDQFNLGTLTIAQIWTAHGNDAVRLNNGTELLFKGFTGNAYSLFVGYH
jgi:hypothetical protein